MGNISTFNVEHLPIRGEHYPIRWGTIIPRQGKYYPKIDNYHSKTGKLLSQNGQILFLDIKIKTNILILLIKFLILNLPYFSSLIRCQTLIGTSSIQLQEVSRTRFP